MYMYILFTNFITFYLIYLLIINKLSYFSLKFWPLMDLENEKSVSHSDSILCYTVTHDNATVITGSNDMSLKVWEVATGKLTQVRRSRHFFIS